MTIKMSFEGSSQKRGGQRVRKEGEQWTHLEILLSASSIGKTAFCKVAFLFFPPFPAWFFLTLAALPRVLDTIPECSEVLVD